MKDVNWEMNCYGMTEAEIREEFMNSITTKFSGIEMTVASLLSDCQELLSMNPSGSAEQVRKYLNIAKFCLFEQLDTKRGE